MTQRTRLSPGVAMIVPSSIPFGSCNAHGQQSVRDAYLWLLSYKIIADWILSLQSCCTQHLSMLLCVRWHDCYVHGCIHTDVLQCDMTLMNILHAWRIYLLIIHCMPWWLCCHTLWIWHECTCFALMYAIIYISICACQCWPLNKRNYAHDTHYMFMMTYENELSFILIASFLSLSSSDSLLPPCQSSSMSRIGSRADCQLDGLDGHLNDSACLSESTLVRAYLLARLSEHNLFWLTVTSIRS